MVNSAWTPGSLHLMAKLYPPRVTAILTHQQATHFLRLDKVRESQSRPSYKPSPVVAHADWINHCLLRILCKPSFSVTSAAGIALGKSCLLANTSKTASRISSSFNILESSSRASSARSLSLLSTTKTH